MNFSLFVSLLLQPLIIPALQAYTEKGLKVMWLIQQKAPLCLTMCYAPCYTPSSQLFFLMWSLRKQILERSGIICMAFSFLFTHLAPSDPSKTWKKLKYLFVSPMLRLFCYCWNYWTEEGLGEGLLEMVLVWMLVMSRCFGILSVYCGSLIGSKLKFIELH